MHFITRYLNSCVFRPTNGGFYCLQFVLGYLPPPLRNARGLEFGVCVHRAVYEFVRSLCRKRETARSFILLALKKCAGSLLVQKCQFVHERPITSADKSNSVFSVDLFSFLKLFVAFPASPSLNWNMTGKYSKIPS